MNYVEDKKHLMSVIKLLKDYYFLTFLIVDI